VSIGAWIGIAIVAVAALGILFITRLSGRVSEEEARGDYEELQKDAIKADQERANEIEDKAAKAAKAAAAEPPDGSLSERLQRSGRSRRTTKD
jgi:hypothetical protein